jgi:hypothetical protein
MYILTNASGQKRYPSWTNRKPLLPYTLKSLLSGGKGGLSHPHFPFSSRFQPQLNHLWCQTSIPNLEVWPWYWNHARWSHLPRLQDRLHDRFQVLHRTLLQRQCKSHLSNPTFIDLRKERGNRSPTLLLSVCSSLALARDDHLPPT